MALENAGLAVRGLPTCGLAAILGPEAGPGRAAPQRAGRGGKGPGKGLRSAAHRHGGAVRRQPAAGRPLPPAMAAATGRETTGEAAPAGRGGGRGACGAGPAPWRR